MLIDDHTIIIPGHGRPSSKKELTSYITMLEDIKNNTLKALELGKTLEQITTDTTISGAYDIDYGTGFINPERMRSTFYNSLKD